MGIGPVQRRTGVGDFKDGARRNEPAAAAGEWIRLNSDHFELYTSAGDRERTQPITEGFPPLNWYAGEKPGMVTVDGDPFYHSVGDTPANTTDTEPYDMGWCARVGLLSSLRLMSIK